MKRVLLLFAGAGLSGALLAAPAAVRAGAVGPAPAPAAPTAPAADLRDRLMTGVAAGERLLAADALRLFYGERGVRSAWVGAAAAAAGDLLAAIRAVDREGLRPADYHLRAIEGLLGRLRDSGPADADARTAFAEELDLLLSDAFFLLAAHLTGGRVNPETVEPEWNIAGRARNTVLLLSAALGRGHLAQTLRDLSPSREDYRRLRDALAALRAVASAGGWPIVPWGPNLREGDRGPRVAALRRRLAATAELPPGSDVVSELFDAPLAEALRRFQARHGIEPDAVAGKRTLSELNTPANLRAAQIEANLERLRWMPRELGPRHILVNVADYRLVLSEGGAPALVMRVIAGRQARRTPFFTGEITSILLNPSWTVPQRIAVEDKLPMILDNRDFLADQGFRVFTRAGRGWREIDAAEVDWVRLSERNFPYRLHQDPGPKNALGRIKFQVPNRHDIYLHDTPTRGLFARAERGFSSGCIRVELPLDLAARLLARDPAWGRKAIEEQIASLETVSIRLPEPMPVYILSWTAWVDDAGLLQFREDLYGRDAAILEALARPLGQR